MFNAFLFIADPGCYELIKKPEPISTSQVTTVQVTSSTRYVSSSTWKDKSPGVNRYSNFI